MIALLESLEAWHWMLLGILLIGLEILGTGGILLGAGVAAFVTCLVALSNVEWQVQIGVFIFLSFFFTLIYFKKIRKHIQQAASEAKKIVEQKAQEPWKDMVGRRGKVLEGNSGQAGKAEVDGKTYTIQCKQVLEINDDVSVKSYNGKTLHVYKLI